MQCRHHALVIPLLEELRPLLLTPPTPPAPSTHQPPSDPCGMPLHTNSQQASALPACLQRFKAYLELVNEALQSLLSTEHASKGPAELTNLDTASAAVLRLAVRLCEAIPDSQYGQVPCM